jgi:hypothetical protein
VSVYISNTGEIQPGLIKSTISCMFDGITIKSLFEIGTSFGLTDRLTYVPTYLQ